MKVPNKVGCQNKERMWSYTFPSLGFPITSSRLLSPVVMFFGPALNLFYFQFQFPVLMTFLVNSKIFLQFLTLKKYRQDRLCEYIENSLRLFIAFNN